MHVRCCLISLHLFILLVYGAYKGPRPYNQTNPSAKFDNPNYIRDRYKYIIKKPIMPESFKNRFHQPFHPAWMDYCDPYQCNDYHRTACGLNRQKMKFKWFQSVCHIIYNNMCSEYRGSLKYDVVENKFCSMYVMFLRSGCRTSCNNEIVDPKCAMSSIDGHTVLFVNQCALNATNCREQAFQEYDEVDMKICEYYALAKYYL
ncbi:hypothetical protein K1T71_000688 [Dendrolimus kikuchii]|uniref:Uncharacterized protein n=1 Tax=Dendrolimus kikuchii TaxID=765133 RepID=A0ACC1DK53_9NEOP|nr:hypothetical protein K1T71_000688 [Dendrolimus kikuchii]